MEIKLGDLKVLNSGIIFCEKNQEITFKLEGMILKLIIKDNEEKRTYMSFKIDETDSSMARITFYNIDEAKAGLFQPTELGDLNGKKIFLAFAVQEIVATDFKKSGLQLTYCWYIKE